jgi:hypothetical protein
MMSRTGADADVVLLRDGILFGQDTLFGLIIEFQRSTKVLFSSQAYRLTLLQGHIVEDVDLERSTQSFVLLFDVHNEAVTTSLGIQTCVLQIVRIGIVLQQLGMGPASKSFEKRTKVRMIY